MKKISKDIKELIKDAPQRLKGYARREYQAHITLEYFEGNARKAEREMGGGRDRYKDTGRKRTEDRISSLSEDIRSLAEPQTQADPSMKNASMTYTKITSYAMRKALIRDKGYSDEELPNPSYLFKDWEFF